jgi:hypothetical protein
MSKRYGLGLGLALAAGVAVAAPPELEAEQVGIDGTALLGLGGSSQQQLAQAFTLDRAGYVSHILVPMSCQPEADVRVTIEKTTGGAPNGGVLAYEELPGHLFTSIPTPAVGMRMVEFSAPPLLGPGQYALTLRVKGKHGCGVYVGPHGDSYAAGKAWFIALPNPPLWIELFDAGGIRDMAFQVYQRPL